MRTSNMKRKGDEERQLSKESYFNNEDKEVVIDFAKAAPEVLSSRRMVTALRQPDKIKFDNKRKKDKNNWNLLPK